MRTEPEMWLAIAGAVRLLAQVGLRVLALWRDRTRGRIVESLVRSAGRGSVIMVERRGGGDVVLVDQRPGRGVARS